MWREPATGGTPRQLTFQHAKVPRWAPDGRTLAFIDTRGVWTIPASGGTPTQVVAAEHVLHDQWSRDGKTLYYRLPQALWGIDVAAGGSAVPREVARLDDLTRQPDRAEFSVDDGHFLVSLSEHDADLWLLELDRAP